VIELTPQEESDRVLRVFQWIGVGLRIAVELLVGAIAVFFVMMASGVFER